jgi:hypothetical protein
MRHFDVCNEEVFVNLGAMTQNNLCPIGEHVRGPVLLGEQLNVGCFVSETPNILEAGQAE